MQWQIVDPRNLKATELILWVYSAAKYHLSYHPATGTNTVYALIQPCAISFCRLVLPTHGAEVWKFT